MFQTCLIQVGIVQCAPLRRLHEGANDEARQVTSHSVALWCRAVRSGLFNNTFSLNSVFPGRKEIPAEATSL